MGQSTFISGMGGIAGRRQGGIWEDVPSLVWGPELRRREIL